MESETERRVRERAYEIWLREGKPHGRHAQHWEAAQAEIAAEEREEKASSAAARPAPSPGEAAPERPAAPVRSRRAASRTKAGPKTRASTTDGAQGDGAVGNGRRDR
jgi:hypothetical protein